MGEAMTCRAAFAGLRTLLTGSASLDTGGSCLPTSAGGYGPARTAGTPPKPAGVEPLVQRLILTVAAREARNLRRAKLASSIEAELRDLTTDILRRG